MCTSVFKTVDLKA